MKLSRLRIALLSAIVAAPLLFLVWSQAAGPRYSGLRAGDRLPVADLLSSSGERVSTGSWHGNPTLLVLFQPGCKACLEEIASLAHAAPLLTGVRIILLSVRPDMQNPEAPFPVYMDPSGAFVRKTRKLLVPTLYWIDAEGVVRYGRAGRAGSDDAAATFRDLLSRR